MTNLISRLEQAQGGDRELDADIAMHFDQGPGLGWITERHNPGSFNHDVGKWRKGSLIRTPEPYTKSVDAALSLAEHVLPGKWNDLLREALSAMTREHNWHICHVEPGQLDELPRQICIAILRAHGGSNAED